MFIIHDIFHLHFGHYKQAKALIKEALDNHLLPAAQHTRVLSDFTGGSYRLIFEEARASLADYQKRLEEKMEKDAWQKWYAQFIPHVQSSHREILKEINVA